MWPRELVGTEQEANVSALSMAQRNAIGDRAKASCIFGCLVVMDSPTPLVGSQVSTTPKKIRQK